MKENKDRLNKISRKYHEENKDKIKKNIKNIVKKNKENRNDKTYREKKKKIKQYKKIIYAYKNSWGGDERYNNNLLKIDITIFD